MPITITGPATAEYPQYVWPTMTYIKKDWGDQWQFRPDLRMQSAKCCVSGQDLDSAVVKREYGYNKQTWESDFCTKQALGDLSNWWIKVVQFGPQGQQPIWTGRFSNEDRDGWGSQAYGPSGVQSYTCYGPLQILRKIAVSTSYWETWGQEKEMQWVPSVNDRDERGWKVGNRSLDKLGDTYVYCGTPEDIGAAVWTHYQYAEYVLKRFVDESAAGGPSWSLAGQADILKQMTEIVPMGTSQTVDAILRALIPTELGIDYTIFATDEGFVVWVFALSPFDWAVGPFKLPANPNHVQLSTSQTLDNLETRIVSSVDHGYERLRILGKRAVICCSLYGAKPPAWAPWAGSLAAKWDPSLETLYRCNPGPGPAASAYWADMGRQSEKYRTVYQDFGAPANWDFNGGTASPVLGPGSTILPPEWWPVADAQVAVRRTLDWTPLQEGIDYTQSPPVNTNPAHVAPEFLPPQVWIGKYLVELDYLVLPWIQWRPAEELGIDVQANEQDWGVLLSSSPKHLLAKNHWAAALPTAHAPVYDYDRMIATIAFESDQRLTIHQEMPFAKPSGGVRDIEVEDAEYWVLAPYTIVRSTGSPVHSGPFGRVLRDDSPRMFFVAAGAISRYLRQRARAEIVAAGIRPWMLLLGQIVTVVDDGGNAQVMQSPISQVEWTIHEDEQGRQVPKTTITAGYAI